MKIYKAIKPATAATPAVAETFKLVEAPELEAESPPAAPSGDPAAASSVTGDAAGLPPESAGVDAAGAAFSSAAATNPRTKMKMRARTKNIRRAIFGEKKVFVSNRNQLIAVFSLRSV